MSSPSIKQLDSFAKEWITLRSLTLAKFINKTTLEALRHELALGFEAGESIKEIAKRIEVYFDTNAKVRAEMISRTEVIAASNRGAQDRYQKEGIQKKEWFSAPDARPSHLEANGQIVGINDNFRVGDGMGQGPAQIGLPEEDINCRCVLLPVID